MSATSRLSEPVDDEEPDPSVRGDLTAGIRQRLLFGEFLPTDAGWGRGLLAGSLPYLVYLAGQLVTLVVVGLVAQARGTTLTRVLLSWDAQHFVAIAQDGYDWSTGGDVVNSPAFFPGLPAVMRLVHLLTGWTYSTSGYVVPAISALVMVAGLVRLLRMLRHYSDTAALTLIGLIAVGPISVVLMMIYTESMFCAVVVWGLVALLDRRWLTAAALAVTAGLIRPTGAALAGAVMLVALVALCRPGRNWQMLLALVLSPVGVVGYILYAGHRIGSWNGWFTSQNNGWKTNFDWGHSSYEFIRSALIDAPAVLNLVVVAVIGASIVLLILLVGSQPNLAVITYTALVMISNIGSGGIMNSKVRLMLPALPLLFPVAGWLARQRPLVLGLTLACYLLIGTWYSAYGLVIYGYAI